MNDRARPGNRNPDPVISLNRQFNKLMQGKSTPGIKDRPVGGWVKIREQEEELDQNPPSLSNRTYQLVPNRYKVADRIYQMQVDYMYLIKAVSDSQGKNTSLIKGCQEFINSCREELGRD